MFVFLQHLEYIFDASNNRKRHRCVLSEALQPAMVLNLQPIAYGNSTKQIFFTKGIGVHEKDMRAFEEALRDAGVHTCNFVKVSSVIPPGCKLISKEEGIKLLRPGQITFAIMAQSMTNEPEQIITAGIGMAQPKDKTQHGFLTEAEEIIGRTAEDVEQDVIEMSIENLITQWNPKFDGEKVFHLKILRQQKKLPRKKLRGALQPNT